MKTMRRIITMCLLSSMMLVIGGCSLFSPVKGPEINKYLLNKVPYVAKRGRQRTILLVLQPQTRAIFDTTQIAYSTKPYQIAYFAKNEWAETPSQMFEQLVTQTLQNTHHYKAVASRGYAGNYDYALYVKILDLKENFTEKPAVFDIRLRAQLVRSRTGRIVAEREFAVHEPIGPITPYNGILAGNTATSEVLAALARFCVGHS